MAAEREKDEGRKPRANPCGSGPQRYLPRILRASTGVAVGKWIRLGVAQITPK